MPTDPVLTLNQLAEAAVKLSKAAHRMTFGAPPVLTGPRLS